MRTGTIRTMFLAGGLLAAMTLPAAAQGAGGGEPQPRSPMRQRMIHGGAGQWWKNPEMVDALGLDDATRQQIEEEVYRSQQEMIGLRADAERENLELQRLLQSQDEKVDLHSIEQHVDRLVSARGSVMKEEIMLRAHIMALLTPDQRLKLEDLFAQRRQQFRDGALERQGPPLDEPPPPPDELP